MENKEVLQDEELKNVSGGFIYEDTKGTIQIIGEDGNVLKLFHNYDEALAFCEENGISTKRINWEEVVRLRDAARKKNNNNPHPVAPSGKPGSPLPKPTHRR